MTTAPPIVSGETVLRTDRGDSSPTRTAGTVVDVRPPRDATSSSSSSSTVVAVAVVSASGRKEGRTDGWTTARPTPARIVHRSPGGTVSRGESCSARPSARSTGPARPPLLYTEKRSRDQAAARSDGYPDGYRSRDPTCLEQQ